MKGKLLTILLILFCIPVLVVAAETCNPDDVKITSIEVNDTRGNIEEVTGATGDNNVVNLDLKMNVPGDTIEYKLTLNNTSNEDYYFDEDSLNIDKDNVNYEIVYEDGSDVVQAGQTKTVYLRVSYKDKIETTNLSNGVYTNQGNVTINLTNNSVNNPPTGDKIIHYVVIIIASITLMLVMIRLHKKLKYLAIIIVVVSVFSFTPTITKAICKCVLEIESNVSIDAKEGMFLPGTEVNIKMKELAGDDTSTERFRYGYLDTAVTAIKKSETEPDDSNKEEKNIASMPDSPYPIYMWFDNGTIYWWSEDNTPSLNPSSGSMFNKFSNLNDISGVKNWDTTEVTNIDFMFNITSITDLTNLSKWNTSNITGMSGVFGQNTHLQSLSGIENWDTSNVTNIGYLLYESPNIESIDEIKNWDTSKVTNMVYLFYKNSVLTSIDGLDNWDTSNLKQMQGMFGDMANVEEIDISNFDTRNVTNFKKIFDGSKKLKHIYVGENWDTSSNTNESTYVFPVTSELPNFSTSNENYRDLVWAHYGEGGYLTLKTNEGGN